MMPLRLPDGEYVTIANLMKGEPKQGTIRASTLQEQRKIVIFAMQS